MNVTVWYLDFSQAKDFTEFPDICCHKQWTMNGIMLEDNMDAGSPIPWDAEVSIEGDNFLISGGVGPNDTGNCDVSIPKYQAHLAYHVYLEVYEIHSQEVQEILESLDIEILRKG